MTPGANMTSHNKVQTESWMITFADLLGLILTFFVLLLSMNTISFDSWEAVSRSFNQELNPKQNENKIEEQQVAEKQVLTVRPEINLGYLTAVLDQLISSHPEIPGVRITQKGAKLILSLPSDAIFAGQTASLNQKGDRFVRNMAEIFGQLSNQVSISGHTDIAKPDPTLFSSNWDLSLERATEVRNTLIDGGYRGDMIAFGFADSKFSEIDPSMDIASRYIYARRVDIEILDRVKGEETIVRN